MTTESPSENSGFRLYVGNLDARMTDAELKAMIRPFGAIKRIQIVRDELTGNSKGYGFVEMLNRDEAERVAFELNKKRVDGHFLTARPLF